MSQDRATLQAKAAAKRKPVATIQRSMASLAASPAHALQQRLGNRGTRDFATQVARSSVPGVTSTSGAAMGQLSLSHPDDAHEREADRVADEVMRMTEGPTTSRSGSPDTRVSPGAVIQRLCAECEEESKGLDVQRKEAAPDTPQATPGVVASVSALRGGGSPLPASTREFFEPRFGANFSQVRVHTDTNAARTASSINATAFTVGRDIAFGTRQFSPDSQAGRLLLAHELTHVTQNGFAAESPTQPDHTDAQPTADTVMRTLERSASAPHVTHSVSATGVQIQRSPKKMDDARYRQIQSRLGALVAQKRAIVEGSTTGVMEKIDAEIDVLIAELRLDFGVRIDKGQILEAALANRDTRVVDGRIVVSPSGKEHFWGERMEFILEVDFIPPGEALQIGWRWTTPQSRREYQFGAVPTDKSTTDRFDFGPGFWSFTPHDIEKAQGLEVLAYLYVGNQRSPVKRLSTGFIPLPHKPIPDIKVINAPKRVVKGAYLGLQIGPYTPDLHGHSLDWFVDGKLSQEDAPNFHKQFSELGTHSVRADLFKVRRSFGIHDKKFEKRAKEATFEVLTDQEYGEKSIEDLENSPFRPKPVSVGDVVASGEKSLKEIQHRINQGGSQAEYWKERLKAQKDRLEKIKELAPQYASAKPLPSDPTVLERATTYSGPIVATLVMSTGGGGAQPLSMHLTVSESGGVYSARLLDSTSKKVVKYDGTGATPLQAYADAFATWQSNNEYPTGGRVVYRFAPPSWNRGNSFSTTTTWKKAKDWVDGIIQIGGFIVAALLLSSPDPTISKALGAILMAVIIARSSVAIYERIREGGDILSSENILDAVAIVTAVFGVTGSVLRSAGLKAINPTTYRVGNWLIMGAVTADAGTFVYATTEAVAALRVIQADPTLDDGAKSGEMLRIMASLFATGAMLIVTNKELIRGGLKPSDFIKSEIKPGMKPKLDVGARLDAEYELKKAGQWTKETSKLSNEALLDAVFTNRSRQELETTMARKLGEKRAKEFADALGNQAFVALHTELGERTMLQLAQDIGTAKVKGLHDALGIAATAGLTKELGVPGLKKLTDHLTGKQIGTLVGDLSPTALKNLTGGPKGMGGNEIVALSKKHGAELVKWAGETLQGGEAKALLSALKGPALKALQDVPASVAKELVRAYGLDAIHKLAPPVTGRHLNTERIQLGDKTAKDLAKSRIGPADFAAHAERLEGRMATTPRVARDAQSVIVDANVIIGIGELMNPLHTWKNLQPHKQQGINYLRSRATPPLPPLTGDPPGRTVESIIGKGHDLRLANVTLGEPRTIGDLNTRGLTLEIDRNSAQYNAVLGELAKEPPIGAAKGSLDRAMIADAMFSWGSGKPVVMTGDVDVFARLYNRYGPGKTKRIKLKPGQREGDAIAEQHAGGFDVEIPDGVGGTKTMTVIPMR